MEIIGERTALSEAESLRSAYESAVSAVPPATRQRQLAPVKHGLYVRAVSGRKLKTRIARRLAARVWAALPWLMPSDEASVRGWCELEVVSSRLFVDVLERVEPGTIDLYRRVKQLQLAYERELGMTPTSRAALGLTVSQGASYQERLASALAAKRAREEGQ